MKPWLLCLLCVLSGPSANAQAGLFFSVDNRAAFFPAAVTHSSSTIAKYIEEKFDGDENKIRAAYRWVTANIKYDKDSMLAINWSKENDEKIAATLRRKKGVCDNFASLFTDILTKMNIKAFVVNGRVRTSGSVFILAHSWSAAQVSNEWLFFDPTWDMAYANTPRYFGIRPDEFIETHWPFDPLWQLLQQPVSYNDFEKGISRPGKSQAFINVRDSLNAFLALSNLEQLEASARRMKVAGPEKEEQKNWYAYNQMNIAIIYGEKDMQLYNAAVEDLNQANACFNRYAQYRNNLFQPEKPDEDIAALLSPVQGRIDAALNKIKDIGKAKENYQYDTGGLKEKLKLLGNKLEEQQRFLQKYFATAPAERPQLFYQ